MSNHFVCKLIFLSFSLTANPLVSRMISFSYSCSKQNFNMHIPHNPLFSPKKKTTYRLPFRLFLCSFFYFVHYSLHKAILVNFEFLFSLKHFPHFRVFIAIFQSCF